MAATTPHLGTVGRGKSGPVQVSRAAVVLSGRRDEVLAAGAGLARDRMKRPGSLRRRR